MNDEWSFLYGLSSVAAIVLACGITTRIVTVQMVILLSRHFVR